MKRFLTTPALLCVLSASGVGQINWSTSLAQARDEARSQRRPLLVVTYLADTRGAVQMLEHLADRDFVRLAGETLQVFVEVNVRPDPPPRRRGGSRLPKGLSPGDVAALRELLEVPNDRFLVAPQYAFLDPEGKVIASVAERVTKGELEWLWVYACKQVDAQYDRALSEAARAPAKLMLGEVAKWNGAAPPPTEAEVKELIAELRKSWNFRGGGNLASLAGLLRTHDKSAMDYVEDSLRGRGYTRRMTLSGIERLSPRAWYRVVLPVLGHRNEDARQQAAQTLESLAHPKALPALRKQWPKEEDEAVQGGLLRAMAASGPTDRRVLSLVAKALEKSESEDLRAHATLASGLLEKRDAVTDNLARALQDPSAKVRSTAAYVIGWRRDRELVSRLATAAGVEGDVTVKELLEAAEAAVSGASLEVLEKFYDENFSPGRQLLKQLQGLFGDGRRGG